MPKKPVACMHCGKQIRKCFCVMHSPPMWRHHPSGYHRCGIDGVGETFAEPEDDLLRLSRA